MRAEFGARRWDFVGLLFVASFVNYLDRAALSVALPAVSADFSLSPASKGLLLSAFFWSYAPMQLPMGWLADRYSLRWLYPLCFGFWSLSCALTGLAGSFAMLVAMRFLLGIGEAIHAPASMKVISRSFPPPERGLPTGLYDCGTRAALVVGTPPVAWLVVTFGWRRMFVLLGLSCLFWIAAWLAAYPSNVGNVDQGGLPRAPSSIHLTTNRNLLGICVGYFCYGYFGYLLITWLPDYLVQVRHFTLLRAGIVASLPFIVWTLSGPLGGWLSDGLIRHGLDPTAARKAVIAGGFLSGLLLIPAVLVSSAAMSIAFVCGASLVAIGGANLLVIFQTCAPPEEVGMWTGIGNFAGNIGGALSPVVMGLLISRTGSYVPGFAVAPLVLLAGLLSYVFIVGRLEPPLAAVSRGAADVAQ